MKPVGWKAVTLIAICALAGAPWLAGQPSDDDDPWGLRGDGRGDDDDDDDEAVILNIDVVHAVGYQYDTADVSTFATLPGRTPTTPSRNFIPGIVIADIVAVNGLPAKGVKVDQASVINLRNPPNPALGEAIADVPRRQVIQRSVWEILSADGTPVGTIISEGFGGGPPPPGAPSTQTTSNEAIVGGTGAFLGARGQVGRRGPAFGNTPVSVRENPANRRLNGGNPTQYVLQLIRPFGPVEDSDH